jgi:hypothetical protein
LQGSTIRHPPKSAFGSLVGGGNGIGEGCFRSGRSLSKKAAQLQEWDCVNWCSTFQRRFPVFTIVAGRG